MPILTELFGERFLRPQHFVSRLDDCHFAGRVAAGGKQPGYNAANESFPFAAAQLKPGNHLLAVHCRQTGGGQYFDAGLEATPALEAQRFKP